MSANGSGGSRKPPFNSQRGCSYYPSNPQASRDGHRIEQRRIEAARIDEFLSSQERFQKMPKRGRK